MWWHQTTICLFKIESGRVYSFGENKMGQLGLGDQSNAVLVPSKVSYISKFNI